MAFRIGFTDEPDEYLDDDPTVPSAVGLITIGEFSENFVSSLYEWNKEAYESQWLQSLGRFLNGDEKAVLITWYVSQKESSNLQWWASIEVKLVLCMCRIIFLGTTTSTGSFQSQRQAVSCTTG
jgi:hypothetical protein